MTTLPDSYKRSAELGSKMLSLGDERGLLEGVSELHLLYLTFTQQILFDTCYMPVTVVGRWALRMLHLRNSALTHWIIFWCAAIRLYRDTLVNQTPFQGCCQGHCLSSDTMFSSWASLGDSPIWPQFWEVLLLQSNGFVFLPMDTMNSGTKDAVSIETNSWPSCSKCEGHSYLCF